MAATTRPGRSMEDDIAALMKRIDKLERALKAAGGGLGVRDLDQMADCEVLYGSASAPAAGEAFRFDPDADVKKFKGLWKPGSPLSVAGYFDTTITDTEAPQGLEEFMVDSDWDVTRPCLAFATAFLDSTYTPQEVDPPTDPPTYIEGPRMGLQITDGDGGRVTGPEAGYELGYSTAPIRTFYTTAHSCGWFLLRGRPKVAAAITLATGQADGMDLSTTLRVITRVVRL